LAEKKSFLLFRVIARFDSFNFREYQAQRRSLVEELGAEKDRNLATRQKMTSLSAENEELKIQIKGLKEKFEILAQEIEHSRIKSEIRALNR